MPNERLSAKYIHVYSASAELPAAKDKTAIEDKIAASATIVSAREHENNAVKSNGINMQVIARAFLVIHRTLLGR